MSHDHGPGDLDLRGGGVVAVDTASLEAAAAKLSAASHDLIGIGGLMRQVALELSSVGHLVGDVTVARAWALVDAAGRRSDTAAGLADRLRRSAAVYEVVELQARRAAAEGAGDTSAVQRIDDRLATIEAEHPGAGMAAWVKEVWRDATWSADLVGRFAGSWAGQATGPIGALALWGALESLRAMRFGTIRRDVRLRGTAEPVRVTPVAESTGAPIAAPGVLAGPALLRAPVLVAAPAPPRLPATAPTSLADATARIPSTGTAQIRVERYTMPDGSRQFAVYIAGTRTTQLGGADPFDGLSDVQLADGERSSSYDAVLAALAESGAEPGDVVHAFGHSQGGMIATHLAVEGGYDTQTLVTLGSPVDAALPDDTLSVALRHTDDPVAALDGGGLDEPTGAPGSFVAERSADVGLGLDPLAPHYLSTYAETAAMLDASRDPRMDGVRAVFAELGQAASVDVTEYRAERVSPSAGDAG